MRRPGRGAGFTLVETIIALGVASLVVLMALSLNVFFSQRQTDDFARTNLAQDAQLATTYFSLRVQQAGGDVIRPWMALWHENDCASRDGLPACDGSDRLTVVTALNPLRQCYITHQTAAATLQGGTAGVNCCLSADFEKKQLMLVAGDKYAQVDGLAYDAAACTLTYRPGGQASGHDSPSNPAQWTGGTVNLVHAVTYFLDADKHQLAMFHDANSDGVAQPGEVSILLAQTFDFQVALGYDLLGDGNIRDDGSASDSWLHNAAGESASAGVFAQVKPSQLGMVALGVSLGTPGDPTGSQYREGTQLLDGPPRRISNWRLHGIVMKSSPRNSYIFQ